MLKSVKTSIITLFITCLLLPAAMSFSQTSAHASPSHGISITEQYYHWVEMGEAAIPELKKALLSDNWRMRTHALLAMGKTGNQSLAPLVMDRLKNDSNTAVKNCAVTALGDLKEASAVPVLIDYLNRDRLKSENRHLPQQRIIIQALGKIGDPRTVLPLFNLLKSTSGGPLRSEITDALIAINDPLVSRLILTQQSKSENFPYVEAAKISGALPVQGTEDFLLSLINNPRLPVQNSAVIALGDIRAEKSVPVLLALFAKNDQHLQTNTADALIKINSPTATIPLCNLLANPDAETAMTSALILTRMTDQKIGDQVYHRFASNRQINGPAAVVLGQKQFAKAIPMLRKRLQDASQPGQEEMAEALGWLNDRESIPLLLKVASRKTRLGAAGAIWSLGHLKAKAAIPLLLKILKRQDRQLTAPAVFALGDIKDPATAKPLINLYYESGFQYQMQVALALARIGGPEVAEILKTNMESGNSKRRQMAGYMLLKSRDRSLIPYAISLLNAPEESIRRYAFGALKNMTGQNFDTIEQWRAWKKKTQ